MNAIHQANKNKEEETLIMDCMCGVFCGEWCTWIRPLTEAFGASSAVSEILMVATFLLFQVNVYLGLFWSEERPGIVTFLWNTHIREVGSLQR